MDVESEFFWNPQDKITLPFTRIVYSRKFGHLHTESVDNVLWFAHYVFTEGNKSKENPVGSYPSRKAKKKCGSTFQDALSSTSRDALAWKSNALTMFRKHSKLTKHSESKQSGSSNQFSFPHNMDVPLTEFTNSFLSPSNFSIGPMYFVYPGLNLPTLSCFYFHYLETFTQESK